MIYELLNLKADKNDFTLRVYEHVEHPELPTESRPAMLVIPGGGYAMCSEREAEPVAVEFFNRGYNAYVINYPCAPARYPAQLVCAAMAMDTIRKRAVDNTTDKKRVYAVGFSAGGHLCGTLANCPPDFAPVKQYDFKPNGVILSYPVISEKDGHVASYENMLGDRRDAQTAWLNLDESVRADNPPAFIWTTATDTCVPPSNALRYATAYNALGLPYELHVFDHGAHGLSLADERVTQLSPPGSEDPKVALWVEFADKFFKRIAAIGK